MAPKKISKARIFQHFLSLPEEQRTRLLREHLSDKATDKIGETEFRTDLSELRVGPEKELRAYLTDDKNFGGSWKALIPIGEHYAGGHLEDIYSGFGGKSITDEDKIYAQVKSSTIALRLEEYWRAVKGEPREAFIRKGLLSLHSMKGLAVYLEDPKQFREGKSPDDFARAVMATMDLDSEKSIMECFREKVPADDPDRKEKLQRFAQQCMIRQGSLLDPEDIAGKLQNKNWKKTVSAPETAIGEARGGRLKMYTVVPRIREAMEIAETDEEKELFREAALQTIKDIKPCYTEASFNGEQGREIREYAQKLQEELTADGLKKEAARQLRESLAGEYRTLEKEKTGWFLSKKNTNEFNDMMDGLRLFNAKLDLLEGKKPAGLTPQELEMVKNTDAKTLYDEARTGCYNYGCKKTTNGKKGFVHDAGTERFGASMKTLSQLNELGKQLHLADPASALRNDVQLELLQHRRDKKWMAENIEDVAAKAICSQVLQIKDVPAYQQRGRLSGDDLQKQLESIKSSAAFKQMIKNVGPDGVADAVIKSGNALAEAYNKGNRAARKEGCRSAEIAPEDLKSKEEKGLSSPVV